MVFFTNLLNFQLNVLELKYMKNTLHKFINSDSRKIEGIKKGEIDLVVTSPPYPMVKMWDWMLDKESDDVANDEDYKEFCDLLDKVWKEMARVIKDGGIMAINMGDATRKNSNGFLLYSNASPIIQSCTKHGFTQLPGIIWSKPTNSPNKFMGSGMYPVKAYVTLEHEHILLFRKGEREFNAKEMENRRESAFFWEERNKWFSDIWTGMTGTKQKIEGVSRERNGAFPLELPFRIINMFSVKGDNVLDPFMGTGTTAVAAAATERNSFSVDIQKDFVKFGEKRLLAAKAEANKINKKRIKNHIDFAEENIKTAKSKSNINKHHGFKVKTKWETELIIREVKSISKSKDGISVEYKDIQ